MKPNRRSPLCPLIARIVALLLAGAATTAQAVPIFRASAEIDGASFCTTGCRDGGFAEVPNRAEIARTSFPWSANANVSATASELTAATTATRGDGGFGGYASARAVASLFLDEIVVTRLPGFEDLPEELLLVFDVAVEYVSNRIGVAGSNDLSVLGGINDSASSLGTFDESATTVLRDQRRVAVGNPLFIFVGIEMDSAVNGFQPDFSEAAGRFLLSASALFDLPEGYTVNGASGLLRDNVLITAGDGPAEIPEPGTALLFAIGLMPLALLRRRTRRSATGPATGRSSLPGLCAAALALSFVAESAGAQDLSLVDENLRFRFALERQNQARQVAMPASYSSVDQLFDHSLTFDGLMSTRYRLDVTCHVSYDDCAIGVYPFDRLVRDTRMNGSMYSLSSVYQFDQKANEALSNAELALVETFNDLDGLRDKGRYGYLLYTQKHPPLRGNPKNLEDWKKRGLRVFQIAYGPSDLPNQAPEEKLAGGFRDTSGLTSLGYDVVNKLAQLNIVIDVSHTSAKAVKQIAAMNLGVPIIANHANADAVHPSLRNKDDHTLLKIKSTGGVVCAFPLPRFTERRPPTPEEAGRPLTEKERRHAYYDTDDAFTEYDFMAQVDYMVNLLGEDHVCVATDSGINDSWEQTSPFFEQSDRWYQVALKLRSEYGYSYARLGKIFGGNIVRVLQQVMDGMTDPVHRSPVANGSQRRGAIRFAWDPALSKGTRSSPSYRLVVRQKLSDGSWYTLTGNGYQPETSTTLFLDSGQYEWRVQARSFYGGRTDQKYVVSESPWSSFRIH